MAKGACAGLPGGMPPTSDPWTSTTFRAPRQYRKLLEDVVRQLRAVEPKAGEAHTYVRQLDGTELLGAENVNILRPGLLAVRRALQTGIVVARCDEDRDGTQVLKLLFQEFDRVGRDAVVLIQVACDCDEIHGFAAGILQNSPEGSADCLTLPVSEAGGEASGRKTGVQMDIRCVNKANGCHDGLSGLPRYIDAAARILSGIVNQHVTVLFGEQVDIPGELHIHPAIVNHLLSLLRVS
jgi:hypothetical protein